MKTKILKNKLQCINFVTPLYKKDTENTKLDGNDLYVTRKIVEGDNCIIKSVIFKPDTKSEQPLPGFCDSKTVKGSERIRRLVLGKSDEFKQKSGNMLGLVGSSNQEEVIEVVKTPTDKNVQVDGGTIVVHKLPDTWLRVFPASKLPKESFCSIVLRCVFCQMGLIVVLILWTVIWTFVIYAAEESFEIAVSEDFRKKQNKLVIDLATELRQITPISEKWRTTIENRIENERELTMSAVGRGARLEPGCFWSLPGTFLFTVYVMTALGFGAPVPQTLFGRTAALSYAILAVPTHIYLMVNLSTCIVARADGWARRLRAKDTEVTSNSAPRKDAPINISKERANCKRNFRCFTTLITFGHGIPIAAVTYYSIGALAFGVLRGNNTVDTLMYPLDFTTSGGLEHIAGHIRFLYGLFVEGAMVLLACALASLRRCSSGAISQATAKYRLFISEQCEQCDDSCHHSQHVKGNNLC